MWVRSSLLALAALAALNAGGVAAQTPAAGDPPATGRAERSLLTLPAVEARRAAKATLLDLARAGKRYVAVGERGIVVHSDDGKAWTQAKVPVSVTLTGVSFPTPEQGWAVGHEGVVLQSADGGRTWTRLADGTVLLPQLIDWASERAEAARKLADQAKPADRAKADEALEAAENLLGDVEAGLKFGPSRPLLDVLFTSSTRGFVVGAYGQAFGTADGGKSWQLLAGKIGNAGASHYNAIVATPGGKLFLVGEAGTAFRSDDGGETWTRLATPYKGSLYGLIGVPTPKGEAVVLYGFKGRILRSEDAGATWEEIASPAKASLYGAALLDDGTVVLAGAGGTLLASKDAGRTFAPAGGAAARGLNIGVVDAGGGQIVVTGAGGARAVELAPRSGAKP